MSLHGSLREMSVADLIQHYCDDRKNAGLLITSADQEAEIYFQDGNVVHASLGKIEGEEVVYQILGWEDGSFSLIDKGQPPKATINRSWPGLIMEGAKRLDETRLSHSSNPLKDLKVDPKRLLKITEELQKNLGKGLLWVDIWQKSTKKKLMELTSQPISSDLFLEITGYLSSTLGASVFPPMAGYYLLNLEGEQAVVVVDSLDLLLIMFIDVSKTTMGLIINLGIPTAQKGLAEALV